MNNLEQFALVLEPVTRGRIAAFGLTTAAFAITARLLRGVTSSGAVAGGVVCLLLMLAAGWGGFAALGTVFIMTWVATRIGYPRKQQLGSAERHAGRSAGQVLANLGVPALAALLYMALHDPRLLVAMGAALSEVAADTLSSEIGVLGGTPLLLTTWRAVPAGTDGAITWLGTLIAILAALVVSLVCAVTRVFAAGYFLPCAAAGMVGTVADSLLGATLERKGVLNNNGVNFLATACAASLALAFAGHP